MDAVAAIGMGMQVNSFIIFLRKKIFFNSQFIFIVALFCCQKYSEGLCFRNSVMFIFTSNLLKRNSHLRISRQLIVLWTKYHSLQMSPFLRPKNEKSRFGLILQKTDSLKLAEFFIFCQQDGLLSGSSHIFVQSISCHFFIFTWSININFLR